MAREMYDAVVVGAGPNGLTAAAVLADAGLSVTVLEANDDIGGGCRSAALTLPGYVHDVCAAIHPMAVSSPAFRGLGLEPHGLRWIDPPMALAHPFDDGSAACLTRSLDQTAAWLGGDGSAWMRLMAPFVEAGDALFEEVLQPPHLPRRPLLMARFARHGLRSCLAMAHAWFTEPRTRALFAGCGAHSMLPLETPGSASFGLVLALAAHVYNWPCAAGGSQRLADALAARVQTAGGAIATGRRVHTLADVPSSRVVLFDLAPRQLDAIAGDALPARYRRALQRYRPGPGVFKIDWALAGLIPWKAAECRQAATVHVGGTLEEIAVSEDAMARGRTTEKPFVLVAQQSLFDPSRAPASRHTGWAYCHVPNGSTVDYAPFIEAQIERFAPGFHDLILARHVRPPAVIEADNATMIGGDIGNGANDLTQLLLRPFPQFNPYRTPNPRLFLCSSATPPGGGVHGMCGYWAAQSALRRLDRR